MTNKVKNFHNFGTLHARSPPEYTFNNKRKYGNYYYCYCLWTQSWNVRHSTIKSAFIATVSHTNGVHNINNSSGTGTHGKRILHIKSMMNFSRYNRMEAIKKRNTTTCVHRSAYCYRQIDNEESWVLVMLFSVSHRDCLFNFISIWRKQRRQLADPENRLGGSGSLDNFSHRILMNKPSCGAVIDRIVACVYCVILGFRNQDKMFWLRYHSLTQLLLSPPLSRALVECTQ